MRLSVCLQLLLHGEALPAALVLAQPRLRARGHVRVGDVVAELVRLGKHGLAVLARVRLGAVVALLVPLAVRHRPEALAATVPGAHEGLLLRLLVRALVRDEVAPAVVRLAAVVFLALVLALARVRQLVLLQAALLEVCLVAAGEVAREAPHHAAPRLAVDRLALRRALGLRCRRRRRGKVGDGIGRHELGRCQRGSRLV